MPSETAVHTETGGDDDGDWPEDEEPVFAPLSALLRRVEQSLECLCCSANKFEGRSTVISTDTSTPFAAVDSDNEPFRGGYEMTRSTATSSGLPANLDGANHAMEQRALRLGEQSMEICMEIQSFRRCHGPARLQDAHFFMKK